VDPFVADPGVVDGCGRAVVPLSSERLPCSFALLFGIYVARLSRATESSAARSVICTVRAPAATSVTPFLAVALSSSQV